MLNPKVIFFLILATFASQAQSQSATNHTSKMDDTTTGSEIKLLRHIVLFKFKNTATKEEVQKVEAAFNALPAEIKEIKDFEWGTNNSPEQLNKEFTHSFLVTFLNEQDRAAYLVHPAHLAFVEVLKPHLDDVLVLDYWTETAPH